MCVEMERGCVCWDGEGMCVLGCRGDVCVGMERGCVCWDGEAVFLVAYPLCSVYYIISLIFDPDRRLPFIHSTQNRCMVSSNADQLGLL